MVSSLANALLGLANEQDPWAERVVRPMDRKWDELAAPVIGPDLGPQFGRVYTPHDFREMRDNRPGDIDETYQGYMPSAHMIQRALRSPSGPDPGPQRVPLVLPAPNSGPMLAPQWMPLSGQAQPPFPMDKSIPGQALRPDESIVDWLKRIK